MAEQDFCWNGGEVMNIFSGMTTRLGGTRARAGRQWARFSPHIIGVWEMLGEQVLHV